MRRWEIEEQLLRHRLWLVDNYTALPEHVLLLPATQDRYDPTQWWRVKDHFAHCCRLPAVANARIRTHLEGRQVDVLLDDGTLLEHALDPTEDGINPLDHMTNQLLVENRDKTMEELVAVGERELADRFALLAEIPDERLDEPFDIHGRPFALSHLLVSSVMHDRTHFVWALEGLGAQIHQ
jgi:hypothetical protein